MEQTSADTTNNKTLSELIGKTYLSINDLKQSSIWGQLSAFSMAGISNARQLLYHYKNNLTDIPHCECGNKLGWHVDNREYRTFCSKKCTAIYSADARKKTNLEKYGKEWYSQTNEWNIKVKETSINKFGVEHYSQTEEHQDRVIKSNLAKRGVRHVMHDVSVRQSVKETCNIKYGTDTPLTNSHVKDKIKNTVMERYGVDNPLKSKTIRDNIKQTNLKKYGHEHHMQNAAVAELAGSSRKENYYTPDTLLKLNDKEWLMTNQKDKTIHELAEILGVSASNLAKYFHKHGIEIQYHNVTALERKIYEYFQSLGFNVQLKNRSIIAPKEIDILFVDFNFGIEINGGYWHSEQFQPNRFAQLEKVELAKNKGVELWHFWDWELNNNWELIISKLRHRLGLSKKIYARQTTVKPVNHTVASAFLEHAHIQGSCNSQVKLGLYQNEQLCMVATFGKGRYSQKYKWELLRLAADRNLTVVGGASKLMEYFKRHFMQASDVLVSYCHRRFSRGNVYKCAGFTLSHISEPGYVYIKGGLPAGSRNCWQKHMMAEKLPNFDPALTGNQNMSNNGYYRAWDCGQYVFTYSK